MCYYRKKVTKIAMLLSQKKTISMLLPLPLHGMKTLLVPRERYESHYIIWKQSL